MDLFEKLYTVRKLIALNQREAAEKAGLKQATISVIERGDRNSLPNAYLEFLYQNGVDLNWIFNDENDISFAFRSNIINNKQQLSHAAEVINSRGSRREINYKDKPFIKEQLGYETSKSLNTVLYKLLHEIEKLNSTILMKI